MFSKNKSNDIFGFLSPPQREQLFQLIIATAENLRLSLQRCSADDAHITHATPAALKSFDNWYETVIERLGSSLNSHTSRYREPEGQGAHREKPDLTWLHTHYPPIHTPLSSFTNPAAILEALLLLLLHLESYDSRTRVLLVHIASSLHVPLDVLVALETSTAKALLQEKMSADEESAKRAEASKTSKRWKIGIASVGGAVLVGVTGGLAAPLVAAGIGTVMGGLGLGATAAAATLGTLASSGAVVGALFGVYGGRMGGKMMARYAAEVEDFAFLPVRDDSRLRVAVGITGWLVEEEDVLQPWRSLGGGLEPYALRWEMDALLDLGTSLQEVLKSAAMSLFAMEVVKRTVFATLYSVLWPIGLMKLATVVDNPFSIAKLRSDKAGLVLADAILNKAQGSRPVTLVGYSLGARVIFSALLSLAERGGYGLVENAVLLGAPTPADEESWKKIRSVVAGRVVNVYSDQDYILAFLYRTSSIQLGVAGLKEIAVDGIENVNAGETVKGHLRYRYALGGLLRDILDGDVETAETEREDGILRRLIEDDKRKEEEVRRKEEEKAEKKKKLKEKNSQEELQLEEKRQEQEQERDMDEVLARVERHMENRKKKKPVRWEEEER
jgi:hypothetical protein